MPRIEATEDVVIQLPLPEDPGNGTFTSRCSIQRGWDHLFANYDLRGFGAKLKLTMGTAGNPIWYDNLNMAGRIPGQPGGLLMKTAPGYPPFLVGGSRRVVLEGDRNNPFGAFIYNVGSVEAAISMAEGAALYIDGFSMATDWQDAIDVFSGAFLGIGRVVFAQVGRQFPEDERYSNAVSVAMGGNVLIDDKVTVCGPMASFADVGSTGGLYWNTNGDPGLPVDFEVIGNQYFPRGFLLVTDGGIAMPSAVNFIGAARGRRYIAQRRGGIIAQGNKFLMPGDQDGIELDGGWCV